MHLVATADSRRNHRAAVLGRHLVRDRTHVREAIDGARDRIEPLRQR